MCRIGPTSLPQSTVRGQTLIASADAARQPLAPPAPPHVEVDIFERRRRWRRRSRSRKSTSTCEPGADRSRCGLRPISTRKWTDLGTGYDRSRGGARPAQWRREGDSNPRCARRTAVFKTATFGRSVISPCPHNHSNHSMLMRATRHYHHRPGAQRHGPRGQSASAASTASAESTASAAPTGVNRGRRTPVCESVWPTPAPARRACPDVPPPRPAPSPATRADGA